MLCNVWFCQIGTVHSYVVCTELELSRGWQIPPGCPHTQTHTLGKIRSRGVSFSFTVLPVVCWECGGPNNKPLLFERLIVWLLTLFRYLKYRLVMSRESNLVGYSTRRTVATPKWQLYLKPPGVLQTLCGLGRAIVFSLRYLSCAMIFWMLHEIWFCTHAVMDYIPPKNLGLRLGLFIINSPPMPIPDICVAPIFRS